MSTFGDVELERYLRHPSSTDQKAVGYIDVNLGVKTGISVHGVEKPQK